MHPLGFIDRVNTPTLSWTVISTFSQIGHDWEQMPKDSQSRAPPELPFPATVLVAASTCFNLHIQGINKHIRFMGGLFCLKLSCVVICGILVVLSPPPCHCYWCVESCFWMMNAPLLIWPSCWWWKLGYFSLGGWKTSTSWTQQCLNRRLCCVCSQAWGYMCALHRLILTVFKVNIPPVLLPAVSRTWF